MRIPKLAHRYSKALLELAHEKKVLEPVKEDMKFLHEVISSNPDLAVMLKSPVIKSDQKRKVMIEIGKNLNPLSQSFITLLIKQKRESFIYEIAKNFLEQYRNYKGIHLVKITSAKPLSQKIKEEIIKKIKSSLGGTIELEDIINPDIIAGLIITINDKEINASVKNFLNEFKKTFASNLYKPSF
jgi:F-type H+-transporting ATPase subunit delta